MKGHVAWRFPFAQAGIAHAIQRTSCVAPQDFHRQRSADREGCCARVPDWPAKVHVQSLIAGIYAEDDGMIAMSDAEAWVDRLAGESTMVGQSNLLSNVHAAFCLPSILIRLLASGRHALSFFGEPMPRGKPSRSQQ